MPLNLEGELKKDIGWAHSKLMCLMKQGQINTFIDCTFSYYPKAFLQCMVIQVYDRSCKASVLVFYILLQSKLKSCYLQAIGVAIADADWNFDALIKPCKTLNSQKQ
jgi:hypothetical protein